MKKLLLIVDPQNDFVDPKGSLYVPGAEKTIENICKTIDEGDYDSILVTLDSHHRLHVSNSEAWEEKPAIGTVITSDAVKIGKYNPVEKSSTGKIVISSKDQPITIWPEHCIIGSWGHALPNKLIESLSNWEVRKKSCVDYVQKGEKTWYEAYSFLTGQQDLFKLVLEFYDPYDFYVAGFCKDICVVNTIKDLLKHMKPERIKPLDDCMATLDPNSPELKIYETL